MTQILVLPRNRISMHVCFIFSILLILLFTIISLSDKVKVRLTYPLVETHVLFGGGGVGGVGVVLNQLIILYYILCVCVTNCDRVCPN